MVSLQIGLKDAEMLDTILELGEQQLTGSLASLARIRDILNDALADADEE